MSNVKLDGFLSDEAAAERIYIIKKYNDLFAYAKELNGYCIKLMSEIKVDWEDSYRLIISTLFMRAIQTYQGTFLLLERGMLPESRILTR